MNVILTKMGEEYWFKNEPWGQCTCSLTKSDGVITITGGNTIEEAKTGGEPNKAPWKKWNSYNQVYIYISEKLELLLMLSLIQTLV